MKKFVSWRRVSTKKQGKTGLGLAAQQNIIDYFVKAEGGELIADYAEVYTGTELSGCTELRKAIERCKTEGATLIIAKTDRLRNTLEALQVLEEVGEKNIFFCDLPHTDKFTLTLFFSIAEREALITSLRTKNAIDAKKKRGEQTGGTKELWGKNTGTDRKKAMTVARQVSATNRRVAARNNPANKAFREFMEDWQQIHGAISKTTDWQAIADKLNSRGKTTSKGLPFDKNRARAMYASISKIYNE